MEEKNIQKKRTLVIGLVIVAVIVVLLLLTFSSRPKVKDFGSSGKFTEEQVMEDAETVAVLMEQGDYTAILDRCDEELKEDLASMDWDGVKETIGDPWGSYQDMLVTDLVEIRSKGKDYAQVTLTAQYEQVSVDYLLTIGEDGLLAGLRFRATTN